MFFCIPVKKGPGRPNLGKTATIKKRVVMVYLPTEELVKQWKDYAARHDVSVSQFVYELVDNTIRKADASFTPREVLEKQVSDLQAELRRLTERLTQAENLVKENDETIAKYRKKLSEAECSNLNLRVLKKIKNLFLSRNVVLLNDIPGLIGISLNDAKGMADIVDSMNFLVECEFIEENMTEGRWIAERRHKHNSTGKARKRE